MTALYTDESRDRCLALYRRCVAEHEAGRLYVRYWGKQTDCGMVACIGGNAAALWPSQLALKPSGHDDKRFVLDGKGSLAGEWGPWALAKVLRIENRHAEYITYGNQTPAQALTRFHAFIERHWPGAVS